MRAMRAEAFGRYEDLKLTDIPSPALSDGRILVRMTAAGVTPLDHTIPLWPISESKSASGAWGAKEPASLKGAERSNIRRARE